VGTRACAEDVNCAYRVLFVSGELTARSFVTSTRTMLQRNRRLTWKHSHIPVTYNHNIVTILLI